MHRLRIRRSIHLKGGLSRFEGGIDELHNAYRMWRLQDCEGTILYLHDTASQDIGGSIRTVRLQAQRG